MWNADVLAAVYEWLDTVSAWTFQEAVENHWPDILTHVRQIPKFGFPNTNESFSLFERRHILPTRIDSIFGATQFKYPWMCSLPPCLLLEITSIDSFAPIPSVLTVHMYYLSGRIRLSQWTGLQQLMLDFTLATTSQFRDSQELSLAHFPHLTHFGLKGFATIRITHWESAAQLTHLRWNMCLPVPTHRPPKLVWLSLYGNMSDAVDLGTFMAAVAPTLLTLHAHSHMRFQIPVFPQLVEFGYIDPLNLLNCYKTRFPKLQQLLWYSEGMCFNRIVETLLKVPITVVVEDFLFRRAREIYDQYVPIRAMALFE